MVIDFRFLHGLVGSFGPEAQLSSLGWLCLSRLQQQCCPDFWQKRRKGSIGPFWPKNYLLFSIVLSRSQEGKKYKKIFVKDHCDFIFHLIFKFLVPKCWQNQMLYFGMALYKTSPSKTGLKLAKLHIFHFFKPFLYILGPFWSLK